MTEENESADNRLDSAQLKLKQEAWLRLRGALKDVYAEYGGGEAYLRQVRQGFNEDMERKEGPIAESLDEKNAGQESRRGS